MRSLSQKRDVYATDSHVAVRVKNFHDGQNEFLLNISTMEIKEGNYPDMEKTMQLKNVSCEIEVSIPFFMKAVKPFIDKNAISPVVTMAIRNNSMILTSNQMGKSDFKVELPLEDNEGEMTISANPSYILQALEFSRDAEAGTPPSEKKRSGFVNVKFNNPNRPFMFTVGNYDYLVTPVRTEFQK